MPRRFDAVICDIDGCLAPESSDPIDAEALLEVARHNRAAQERGDRPVLTAASGRPEPFAEAMCRFTANRTIPCIAENGVWLYHPDRNRYDRDPAITAEHLAAVHEATVWVERELSPRGVTIQPGKSCSVSLYHPDTEFLRSLEPLVKAEFARRGWPFRISMTWLYINCDLSHISKGTALDRLIKHTGLMRDRLAGIGDTLSDLPIADRVAFFACPANAADAIKARAHYVSPHPEARGVLDILRQLA
jgi:hydroxymethylpyrimidine pyrophosphatase-like HAD family hydrolase